MLRGEPRKILTSYEVSYMYRPGNADLPIGSPACGRQAFAFSTKNTGLAGDAPFTGTPEPTASSNNAALEPAATSNS